MPVKKPYCMTIAGFDPSGGAGLVADCKTFEQLKVRGLSVLTANTVQTEDSFHAVHWTNEKRIIEQLSALLDRYPVKHFKIGLAENTETMLAILETIHARVKEPFITWDPILKPTAGYLPGERFSAALPAILEKISLITPNLPEYEQLFGSADPAETAKQHVVGIYLKGGHAKNPGKDVLYTSGKIYRFRAHVKTTLSKHGTGCILSAALLAYTARKFPARKGGLLAKRYLERTLVSNEGLLADHAR